MRTNSQQRFKQNRTRTYFLYVVLAACLGLIFFAKPIGVVSSYLVAPFETVRVWFLHSQSALPSYIRSVDALHKEITILEENVKKAEYDRVRLAILEEENKHLRFYRESDGAESKIIADVVYRPNETPYDTLVVDRGSADGVVAGALVYAESAVVGIVGRVFPQSALVVLFSTPGVESPVYVYGANVFARGYGMGGGVVRVGVPQGVAITAGNLVVIPISGTGVYGTVADVESDPSNPEQYAYVTQTPTISTLRFVAIDAVPMPFISPEDAMAAVEKIRSGGDSLTQNLQSLITALPVASTTASTTVPSE